MSGHGEGIIAAETKKFHDHGCGAVPHFTATCPWLHFQSAESLVRPMDMMPDHTAYVDEANELNIRSALNLAQSSIGSNSANKQASNGQLSNVCKLHEITFRLLSHQPPEARMLSWLLQIERQAEGTVSRQQMIPLEADELGLSSWH